MNSNLKRKMYMGIGRFMLPVPKFLSEKGLEKGVSGAKAKSAQLSEDDRKVHHYIVMKMASAKNPISADCVSAECNIPVKRVEKIIDHLENLKTFLYRSDGKLINWAYPLSHENTGHQITTSSGERFFAA